MEVQEHRSRYRPFDPDPAVEVEAMGVVRFAGVRDVAEPFDASWPDRHDRKDAA
jgi:hypothetical protein